MKAEHFENVRSQLGFCGIWCGSCVVGNGVLKELTSRYEKIVKDYGLEDWAPKNFNFQDFANGLSSIQAMTPCQGCLKGGGRSDCEMRKCAQNRKIADCSECSETEDCDNSELLKKMRTGARNAGLYVKTETVDRQDLLDKFTVKLKGRWPHHILFST